MMIYLFALIVIKEIISYRVLNSQSFPITPIPQSIAFLASDVIVTQSNNIINLYNTTSQQITQNFTSDTNNPDVQIAGSQVLFKHNSTIYQMQNTLPANSMIILNSYINELVDFSLTSDTIIILEISHIGYITENATTVYYMNLDGSENKTFISQLYNNRKVASNIHLMSSSQYYFINGFICLANLEESYYALLFYKGNETGIQNVYNLTLDGCFMPQRKVLLKTIDTGNGSLLHAITYQVREQYLVHTTRLVTYTEGNYDDWTQFEVLYLDHQIEVVNGNLYSIEAFINRLLYHDPAKYYAAVESPSVLNFNVTQTIVSNDQKNILVITPTNKSYLIQLNNDGRYTILQSFSHPKGSFIVNGTFASESLLVLKENSENLLTIYDYTKDEWYDSNSSEVLYYCVTDDSYIFYVQQISNSYYLSVAEIQSIDSSQSIIQIENITLDSTVSGILCLNSNSVLINPINAGQNISVWQYTNEVTQTATLVKEMNIHYEAYKTSSNIYFSNQDQLTAPIFYTFGLGLITLTNKFLLPPISSMSYGLCHYQVITTNSDEIILAVTLSQMRIISFEYYQFWGNSVIYHGSFPGVDNGRCSFSKAIVLPNSNRISIDYQSYNDNTSKTVTYQLTAAPQRLIGYFAEVKSHRIVQFRINPLTNQQQVLTFLNGNGYERYIFTNEVNSLTLVEKMNLSGYQPRLSQDKQSILMNKYNALQIRNLSNMGFINYQKSFHGSQASNWFGPPFRLIGNDIIQVSILWNITDQIRTFTTIHSYPYSQGPVSTGSINAVSLFGTCIICDFIAVCGSDTSLIQYVTPTNGAILQNITASCPVQLLSLSFDGSLLAYLCTNDSIFVYNSKNEESYFQANDYPQVSYLYLVSNTSLLLTDNGIVYHIDVTLDQSELDQLNQLDSITFDSSSSQVALDYNLQYYAFLSSPQTVQVNNFLGVQIDSFSVQPNQTIVALAFSPQDMLTITTNTSNIIILTTLPCPSNTTLSNGYCLTCDDDPTLPGCEEEDKEGGLSTLAIVLITVGSVIVLGLGVLLVICVRLKIAKKNQKNSEKVLSSSDGLTKYPLLENNSHKIEIE